MRRTKRKTVNSYQEYQNSIFDQQFEEAQGKYMPDYCPDKYTHATMSLKFLMNPDVSAIAKVVYIIGAQEYMKMKFIYDSFSEGYDAVESAWEELEEKGYVKFKK